MPDDTQAPAFGTPEWVNQFHSEYGFMPIAGGDPEGDQPEEQDTPTDDESASVEETPEESPQDEAPEVDWSKRYNDLRPQYDRTAQELAQYRDFIGNLTNAETQAEALRALGLELEMEEGEPDEDFDDFDYDSRFERIEGYLEQQRLAAEQAQIEAAREDFYAQSIAELEAAEKTELTEKELEALVRLADQMEGPDGYPDVRGAYNVLNDVAETRHQRYIESKKAAAAPSGASPSHQPNLDSAEERREWMYQKVEQNRNAP